MQLSDNQKTFLSIIRLGIGHHVNDLRQTVNWEELEALAAKHGLLAIMIDGVEKLPEKLRPPKLILLEWFGQVVQDYENRYNRYCRAIADLAGFYNSHGLKMMILKGYACSQDWPKPKHRPCGDIDIWQFGKQKEADALIESLEFRDEGLESVHEGQKFKKIKIDRSHHHHTVFNWQSFTVENHYDFVNVHAHKSSAELEKIFKELGREDSYFVEVNGEKVYLPSPNLHALFLLRHMVSHFAASEINFRQVLDWAFFVEKHTKEVDWKWLLNLLDEYHMRDFYNCINAICVEDLGFDSKIFPEVQSLPELKQRVLEDILDPEYGNSGPKKLIPRLAYKIKRWQGNAWKQKLCYSESRWSAFWSGVWAKMLKPASL